MSLSDYDVCGYPLFYVHPHWNIPYCCTCMEAEVTAGLVNPDEINPNTHWEGPDIICGECSGNLASAYGEVG